MSKIFTEVEKFDNLASRSTTLRTTVLFGAEATGPLLR